MTDINLKTLTPDTSLPTTGFLFGADSQAATDPSVYTTQAVATTLLGSTSLTGDTLTADAPVLNLAQTWNNGAVTFTGLKFNAAGSSSTNSAAASLLLDLQVGAASKFSVRKDGSPVVPTGVGYRISNFTSPALVQVGAWLGLSNPSSGVLVFPDTDPIGVGYGQVALGTYGVRVMSGGAFAFTSGVADGTSDTFLTRKAAANLRFGAADAAAPLAQTLSVQSVVGGTSNTAGAAFTITGSQGTGSGAGGSIIFQVAPANTGGGAGIQNVLAPALTIASDKTATFAGGTVFQGLYNQIGTGALGSIINFGTGGVELMCSANDTLRLRNLAETLSAYMAVDANNILAIRNTTNAQTLNIYNTYTSSTSFERYSVDWITTANLAIVGPNKGSGGGTQRVQRLSYLEDGGSGSTVPLLGSTCPAASGTLKSWIKIITSDGTTAYIPCWA
jgi:hypothetical protein